MVCLISMNIDFNTGFKEILGTIEDILCFLSVVDNVTESDIESILFKAHYIEQFMNLLKKRELTKAFEIKLKEYFEIKKIPRIPSVPVLEFYSDEVLTKILTLQLPDDMASVAIKNYIKNVSQKRFEELINKLAKFRTLFVDVSQELKDLVPPLEIECILLVECWLKIISGSKEGLDALQSVLKNMFLDPNGVNILLHILCLDSSDEYCMIQEIIVNKFASNFSERIYIPTWKIVLEHQKLESVLLKFPNLLFCVMGLLETITNGIDFDLQTESWQSTVCADLDYNSFIIMVKRFSTFEVTRYKFKKLIYLNKLKGNVIWEHLDKLCSHNNEL